MKGASIQRIYVSVGSEGLRVEEDGERYAFPALPCLVKSVTGGGDALLAGIVHAGPDASVEETARWGLACARCAVESPEQLRLIIRESKATGHCEGIFYWEPECRPFQYKLGAFDSEGRPTVIMDGFKE